MLKRSADIRLAVAYLRASTSEQHLSPDAQRAVIDGWATRAGVSVVAVHEDLGVSGGSPLEDRPGLARALAELGQRRAGFFVVAKRDRLARDVAIALAIERAVARQGARIASADGTGNGETPADQFMRTVIDGAAAYERALIAARTKAALAAKRARGFRAGEVPFGFSATEDGRLVPSEREQAVLAEVGRLRAAGLSLRAVTASCAESGHRSRAGTPLGLTQVARLVARAGTASPTQHGPLSPR